MESFLARKAGGKPSAQAEGQDCDCDWQAGRECTVALKSALGDTEGAGPASVRLHRRGELNRDAAVVGAALRRPVVGNGIVLAETLRRQNACRHSVGLEVILHRGRAPLRQLL